MRLVLILYVHHDSHPDASSHGVFPSTAEQVIFLRRNKKKPLGNDVLYRKVAGGSVVSILTVLGLHKGHIVQVGTIASSLEQRTNHNQDAQGER